MKTKLKALAKLLNEMEMGGSRPQAVQARRDAEIKKLLDDQKQRTQKAIADLDSAIAECAVEYDHHPKDDAVSHAKRIRLDQSFSAMPLNKLQKLDLKTYDYDELLAIASTLRKRGDVSGADSAYVAYEERKNLWKYNPYIKNMEKLKHTIVQLDNMGKDSLYIGESLDTFDPSDFATVNLDTGRISFKDVDGVVYSV
jgi:predicted nucleic acid-binding protein